MDDKKAKNSLKDTFNDSISAAHKTYGLRLENLVVISSQEPIFVSPEIAEALSRNTEKVKHIINSTKHHMSSINAIGIAYRNYTFTELTNDYDIKLIALNTKGSVPILFYDHSLGNAEEIHGRTAILDHELGHLVVREGNPINSSSHVAECASDAYAAIRHIQRFGTDTDFFSAYNRAHHIVFDLSHIHYSSASLQKVEQLAKEQDLSKLPLIETAALAGQIGSKYSYSDDVLKKTRSAFFYIGLKYKEKTNYDDALNRKYWEDLTKADRFELIKDIIAVMMKDKDNHEAYRAGKLFLERPNVKELLEKSPFYQTYFWRKAKKELAAFEKESGIILNLAEAIDAKKHSNQPQTKLESRSQLN